MLESHGETMKFVLLGSVSKHAVEIALRVESFEFGLERRCLLVKEEYRVFFALNHLALETTALHGTKHACLGLAGTINLVHVNFMIGLILLKVLLRRRLPLGTQETTKKTTLATSWYNNIDPFPINKTNARTCRQTTEQRRETIRSYDRPTFLPYVGIAKERYQLEGRPC